MTRFALAWQFLTVLPWVRAKGEMDPRLLGPSMAFYPLIGLLLGLILWIPFWLLVGIFPRGLADGLLILLLVLLTGAFHLDGLADTLDGLAHGRTPDERMRIMKDHRVGTFGVIGLILIIGIKYLAFDSLPKQTAIKGLLVALVLGRYSMVQLLRRAPYARKEGGLGLAFKETLTNREWAAAGILSLGASLLFFKLPGVLLWGTAVFSTLLLEKFFFRKLGGVTGDVLGAANEINETLILLVIAGMSG